MSGRIGFYVYIDTASAPTNWYLFNCGYDGNNRISGLVNGANFRLEYYSGGSGMGFTGSSGALTTQGWHFVEAYWDHTTHTTGMKIDGANEETNTGDTPGAWATAPNLMVLGDDQGTGEYFSTYIDQFISSSDYTRDLYAIRSLTSLPD
jgi:hypothetical protein